MSTLKKSPLSIRLKYKTALLFPIILVLLLNTLCAKSQDLTPKPEKLNAKFRGEDAKAFNQWIQQSLVYPPDALEENIYGGVLIQYTITTTGQMTDVTVLKGSHPLLDAEAIRVVQSSPDWEPAHKAGENVEQRNVIMVNFNIPWDPNNSIMDIESQESVDDGPAFVFVEVNSSFQGGDLNTFREWIKQNLIYPAKAKEEGISGRVTVQFNVDSYGKVVNVKVLRSPDPAFSEETIRVIRASPVWTPAIQGGINVKQMYVIPVEFNLNDPPR